MKVLVTSRNIIKHSAIYDVLGHNIILDSISADCGNPEQPFGMVKGINASLICAKKRTDSALVNIGYDLIISIENGIINEDDIYYDVCDIDIYDVKNNITYDSELFKQHIKVPINDKYIKMLDKLSNRTELGYSFTVGKLITADLCKVDNSITHGNWMVYYGIDRHKQILKTLEWCYDLVKVVSYKPDIRTIKDFPKPGINFEDIFSLFSDMKYLDKLITVIAIRVNKYRPTKIVGLESRGFVFAPLIANKLNIPFVPIRKAGKLPPPTVSKEYKKEYGTDICEVSPIYISDNDVIIPVDDVLATGGSMKAAIELLEECGANIPAFVTLFNIPELYDTTSKLLSNYENIIIYN